MASDFGAAVLGSFGGSAVGSAVVRLVLDARQYEAQLAAQGKKTQVSANAMGSSFSKFSTWAQAAIVPATVAIAAVGVASVRAASDLGESLNKAKVTFGDAAASVIAFSETSAAQLGIAQSEALEAAAAFGSMAQSAGLSEQAAADMSLKLVGLAADMASFNNQDPSEMLDKLRSGLAGEAEPLRRFGVFISEARVKAEAYRLGIAKVGSELTDAQKIQARYNIILQDTTKQQGDFARTVGESLPNQMRVLRAETTDLLAQIGENLIPLVVEAAKSFVGLVEALGPVLDFMGELGPAVGFVGKAFSLMISPLLTVIRGLEWIANLGSGVADNLAKTAVEAGVFQEALAGLEPGAIGQGLSQLEDWVRLLAERFADAGEKAVNFAGMTNAELKDFRASSEEAILGAVGDLESYEKGWELTSRQAVASMQGMAREMRQTARAFEELAALPGSDEFKAFLIEQGPAAVRAFVEGTKSQQAEFRRAWKAYEAATRSAVGNMEDVAYRGGREAGFAAIAGAIAGINSQAEALQQAAYEAASKAALAMREALRAESPSKVTMEIGRDMIEGLILGLESKDEELVTAAEQAIEQMVTAVERQLTALEDALSKVRGKASDLRSTVVGGFGSFLDISGAFGLTGGDISTFFGQQLADARQFASVLKALQTQGLSAQLLQQIAGAGPQALSFAQGLLQMGPAAIAEISQTYGQIGALAGRTGAGLSEAYFGERISELREELQLVRQALRILEKPQRLEVVFRGTNANALEAFILDVLARSSLARTGL